MPRIAPYRGVAPCPDLPSQRPGRAARRRSQERTEEGSATAEFAVILPCIIVLLAVLLGSAACGAAFVRIEEAARVAARALARGDSSEQAVQLAQEIAGPEAQIQVRSRGGPGGETSVDVRAPAPGVIGQWSDWQITATATTPQEPGVGVQP